MSPHNITLTKHTFAIHFLILMSIKLKMSLTILYGPHLIFIKPLLMSIKSTGMLKSL